MLLPGRDPLIHSFFRRVVILAQSDSFIFQRLVPGWEGGAAWRSLGAARGAVHPALHNVFPCGAIPAACIIRLSFTYLCYGQVETYRDPTLAPSVDSRLGKIRFRAKARSSNPNAGNNRGAGY